MRLPLIIGARPRYCKAGAQVPLVRGEWEISVHGLIDTKLHLWSNVAPTHTPLGPVPIMIQGSRNVRIYIDIPGTEECIHAYARRVA